MFRIILCCILMFFVAMPSWACTRILHAALGQDVLVGRNMDWFEDMQTKLIVYPRGMIRNGHSTEGLSVVWMAKYGSIIADAYGSTATDGMNEKGLAAHVLWLEESDYGKRDYRLGLSVVMWVQYYLDNFATVDEAVRFAQMNTLQVTPVFHPKVNRWLNVHLAIEDANGDSAIIEYVDGQAKIYHDAKYTALTNSPTFNLQLDNLKQYSGFGGDKPLPGTNEASDRFVRASYHQMHLPPAYSMKEEVAGVLSVLHNASPPFEPYKRDNTKVHRTIWRTIANLSKHIYYFSSTENFNTMFVQLDQFNLNAGWPAMQLDLNKKRDLVGDVTKEFERI